MSRIFTSFTTSYCVWELILYMRISFTPSIKSLTRRNPQWFPLQTAALVTSYQERHLQKGFFEDKTLWKWSSSDTTVTASRASPASEPQARQESQGARASIYERMSVLPFLLFYICFVSKYLLSTCYFHFYWPRRLQLSGPITHLYSGEIWKRRLWGFGERNTRSLS